jgi:hypothetical protein
MNRTSSSLRSGFGTTTDIDTTACADILERSGEKIPHSRVASGGHEADTNEVEPLA